MKSLFFFFTIICFQQVDPPVSNDLLPIGRIEEVKNQLREDRVEYYIEYIQRKGKGNKSEMDFIALIFVPNKSEKAVVQQYRCDEKNNFGLVKTDTLSSDIKNGAIDVFVRNFNKIEKGKCYHYAYLQLRNPPVGSMDYHVKYSRNEWLLTLVKKDLKDEYSYTFAFKHRLKNKCLSVINNLKMRRRFEKFAKCLLIDE